VRIVADGCKGVLGWGGRGILGEDSGFPGEASNVWRSFGLPESAAGRGNEIAPLIVGSRSLDRRCCKRETPRPDMQNSAGGQPLSY
jgi:hypothetical protein